MPISTQTKLRKAPKIVKLQIECVECGKILGEYVGEEFYISDVDATLKNVVILCEECVYKAEAAFK